jgi:hypothetical protein
LVLHEKASKRDGALSHLSVRRPPALSSGASATSDEEPTTP